MYSVYSIYIIYSFYPTENNRKLTFCQFSV